MKSIRLIAFLLLLLAAACSPATLPSSAPPTAAPVGKPYPGPSTATLLPYPAGNTPVPAQKAVEVSLTEISSAASTAQIDYGATGRLRLSLVPEILEVSRRSDGSVESTSTRPWADAPALEMETCFALDGPCALGGRDWRPFSAEVIQEYPVDWLGTRPVYAAAQVRLAGGGSVPVFTRADYVPGPQAVVSYGVTGVANLKTPIGQQPAPVQTALAATRIAFSVTGSVLIEGSACCKGGVAGTSIPINVAFSASSPAGKVTQMRVSNSMGCQKDAQALDAPWEAFAPSKAYTAQLSINWVGWYISVQYRDDQGNLSPVYCDDISLEGSPPTPTQ